MTNEQRRRRRRNFWTLYERQTLTTAESVCSVTANVLCDRAAGVAPTSVGATQRTIACSGTSGACKLESPGEYSSHPEILWRRQAAFDSDDLSGCRASRREVWSLSDRSCGCRCFPQTEPAARAVDWSRRSQQETQCAAP